jgi:hypothetical protein
MSDYLVKQALAEIGDVVRCCCHEAYTGRGMHDPACNCDSADAVRVVADHIKELEATLTDIISEYDEPDNGRSLRWEIDAARELLKGQDDE